jgi:hypothetical protein
MTIHPWSFDKVKIYTHPFAYLVCENFFTDEFSEHLLEELARAYPRKNSFNTNSNKVVYRQDPKALTKENPKELKENSYTMRAFNSLSSFEFYNSVVEKLGKYIEASTGTSVDTLNEMIANNNHRTCGLAINPAGIETKRREIHTDSNRMLFVYMVYLRLPEDFSSGGALCLFSEDRRARDLNLIGLFSNYLCNTYPSDLWVAKGIDYKNNLLVVLSEGSSSWHEVSTRRNSKLPRICLHGGLAYAPHEQSTWKNKSLTRMKISDLLMSVRNSFRRRENWST